VEQSRTPQRCSAYHPRRSRAFPPNSSPTSHLSARHRRRRVRPFSDGAVGFSEKGCRAARRHYFRPDCVDLLLASGSKKWKVAPAVALSVAQIRPPWASMIDFEIARPMPTPEGFVV